MSENPQVDRNHARYADQLEVLDTIITDGVCPFCIESLRKYHKLPIIKTGDHWLLTKNQWPYEHTKFHYLTIANQHMRSTDDMPRGMFEELGYFVRLVNEIEQTNSGVLAMRYGDMSLTGSSVDHLHAHVIQAYSSDELKDGESVKFRMSGKHAPR